MFKTALAYAVFALLIVAVFLIESLAVLGDAIWNTIRRRPKGSPRVPVSHL